MKAVVELVQAGGNRRVAVDFNPEMRRILNNIDNAVNKAFKDDPNWSRWNLISIPAMEGSEKPERLRELGVEL